MAKMTKHKEAHTSPNKIGMGDYYGTGIKQKVGRVRDGSFGMDTVSQKDFGKPPKSLA